MIYSDFRDGMVRYLSDANSRGFEEKDSSLAGREMKSLFRVMDSTERAMADRVVMEWAIADDAAKRYMAVFLIDELQMINARGALLDLIDHLRKSSAIGAPSELAQVKRIVRELGT